MTINIYDRDAELLVALIVAGRRELARSERPGDEKLMKRIDMIVDALCRQLVPAASPGSGK